MITNNSLENLRELSLTTRECTDEPCICKVLHAEFHNNAIFPPPPPPPCMQVAVIGAVVFVSQFGKPATAIVCTCING